jgi:hypothetical protein
VLIHGAGALADKLIEKKQLSEVDMVLNAKLAGFSHLLHCLDRSKLKLSCVFSSVAGLFGNIGQVDYAMANEILNRMALQLTSLIPDTSRSLSIIWGAWDAGMVTPQIRQLFEQRGVALIPTEQGSRQFAELCLSATASTLVMVGPDAALSSRHEDFRQYIGQSPQLVLPSASLLHSDLLEHHAIDGKPVLPLTFAMGWVARCIEQLFHQAVVVACQRMHVKKGLVIDDSLPAELLLVLEITAANSSEQMTVQATIKDRQDAKVYYSFENIQVEQRTLQHQHHSVVMAAGTDAAELYREKTLFHQTEFQLLRSYGDSTDDEMLFTCQWQPAQWHPELSAHSATAFCPMYADALLQAALVWVRKKEHLPALPMKVEELCLYKPIPQGETLFIRVARLSGDASQSVLSLIALRQDGQVHLTMQVAVVKSKALAAKFDAS